MTITRVRWRERQRLFAADLQAEQAYHLQAIGRHHLAPHDWGVVRGLWLESVEPRYSLAWRLAVGVAIDGYGRELLVREPIEFELPEEALKRGTYRVFLYYCESPSSCPPCAPCRDEPAPRTMQYVHLIVSETLEPITGDAADLALARAAGRVADAPAWPVLMGEITLADSPPTYVNTRYHRQRASILRAPSGRVSLRQGLLGPEDRYHVLVSSETDAAMPVRRVAIDRDGTVHFWKPLFLTGPRAEVLAKVSASAALHIDTVMPSGAGQRIHFAGTFENAEHPILKVQLSDKNGVLQAAQASLKNGRAFLDQRFHFANAQAVALRLVNARKLASRIQVTHKVPHEETRAFVVSDFQIDVAPSKGRLTVMPYDLVADGPTSVPCDDDRRVATDANAPTKAGGVTYFRPAVQAVPAPTARAIQAAIESPTQGSPVTVLRLSGGEFDQGDHAARVAIGSRNTPTKTGWTSAVSMDGGGRVRAAQSGTQLTVKHTLQLPPITTNPADPLTQDLLALAYNAGLRRVGRILDTTTAGAHLKITLTPPAGPVHRGTDLTYQVKVEQGVGSAVTVKRALELIVGKPAPGTIDNEDVALRAINLPATPSANAQTVTVPAFWHAAQRVVLAVELLVRWDGKDYACAAVSAPVAVTDP